MAAHESRTIMYLNFKKRKPTLIFLRPLRHCVHPHRSAVLIVKPVCALLIMALHRLTRWLNRSWFYARRKWLFSGQRNTDFCCEVHVWSVDTWPGDLMLVLVLLLLFSRQNNHFTLNLPFRHFVQEIMTGFPFTYSLSSRKHFVILEVLPQKALWVGTRQPKTMFSAQRKFICSKVDQGQEGNKKQRQEQRMREKGKETRWWWGWHLPTGTKDWEGTGVPIHK